MRRWVINKRDDEAIKSMCDKSALGELVSGVLVSRGITDSRELAEKAEPIDPFLMKDMDKCVEVITNALHNGERITIFGDYDCDGITSTVMLYNYLTAQGGDIDWYIPSREEGYGLNIGAVEKILKTGANLIITVDNGISAHKEAEFIKENGLRLVITDHHQPPAVLPIADAIINPHRNGDPYPFKQLAGCGVVLKLIMAMENDFDSAAVIEQFGDLAAIGTIGDIVPLTGENRYIVEQGLQILPYTENVGLHQLLKITGLCDTYCITATAVAFTICPRINAAGRLTHASEAVELLLAEGGEQAHILSKRLSELNSERQKAEGEIIGSIENKIAADPSILYERVLICEGENYHHGIIGIVSSRLLLKYDKPNIVITIEGNIARGSARSYDGFSLYELLTACDDLLIKYGGHTKAAGFSIESKLIPEFKKRVREYTAKKYPVMPRAAVHADFEPYDYELSLENVEQLTVLQPFGEGNKSPLFLLKNAEILSKKPLKEGKYLSFIIRYGNLEQKILCFNLTYNDFSYETGDKVDILITLDIGEYNNIKSISAQLKEIRFAGFPEQKYFFASDAYEKLRRGEMLEAKLKSRVIPNKESIKLVYDILRTTDDYGRARDISLKKGLNFCMFSVILDIFHEFKLIDKDIIHNKIILIPQTGKTDFAASKVLAKYELCFNAT